MILFPKPICAIHASGYCCLLMLVSVLNANAANTESLRSNQPIKLARPSNTLLANKFVVDLGGYVKADFIYDFNAIGSTDAFDPITIPTDGRAGQNTRFHARQTRLNLDFRPKQNCEDLRLFIEGDFFGSNTTFRLRHAYIRAGRLLAGQTWSTFMDESILPRTLDFESPRSIVLDRRGLLRWTQPVTESLTFAAALEDPQSAFDLDSASAGSIQRHTPDFIARVRDERDWGHLQCAGLVRLLRYRQASGAKDDALGWGLNFTGRVHLRRSDSMIFQLAFGEGIESYRQGNDAAVDTGGILEVLPVVAWVVGYEIDWNDRFSSTFVYSAGRVTNTAFQNAEASKAVEYLSANLVYWPLPKLSYGLEYLYGAHTNKSQSQGAAHRLQFSVRYDLP